MPQQARVSAALASSPGALTKLGCALMASGEAAKAYAIVRQALADRPNDPELLSAARVILAHGIPQWHSSMLAEAARNDAYEQAIARAVSPGMRVLDIGTGSGLLAMIAARAGAGHVHACEANGALAETAREIVAANGYSEKIDIHSKHSTALDRDKDLNGGVDLIIAEIFANDLIGEGALAALDHAVRKLGRPGVRIIPAAATMVVALGYHDRLDPPPPRKVKGFDLSLFKRHTNAYTRIRIGDDRLSLRSEPDNLFTFDFQAGGPFREERCEVELIAKGGAVNGIVQWIRLHLDDEQLYENRPAAGEVSHWAAHFHPMPSTVQTRPGQAFTACGAHDGERAHIWFPADQGVK